MRSSRAKRIRDLPSALDRVLEIVGRIGDRAPAVFLDYDGTLTPIVEDPREAVLPHDTRAAITALKSRCPVAVVSGRDLDDVREMVDVEGIHYAGSHGFDILEADGTRHRRAAEWLPLLARSADALEHHLADIPGAWVERKSFAIAVHFRTLADPSDAARVEEAMERAVAEEPKLERTSGKKIFELRPAIDWDKGRAIRWMMENLMECGEHFPLYLGDDVTDEDGFRALADEGVGIVVEGEENRETAAGYSLSDTVEVRAFLELLAERIVSAGAPGPNPARS